MTAQSLQQLSIKEYVELEQSTQTKYEYHNGEVFALAGGTINHSLLCGSIYGELRHQLKAKNKDCLAFTSEMKLNIAHSKSYVYPDAMVVCGEYKIGADYKHAITNPVLIVEVLSKSSADYDRGDKFYKYRTIDSFQEYLLIEQDKPQVELFYRKKDAHTWQIDRFEGLDAVFPLQSLSIEISMNALYDKVKFAKDDVA